MKTKALIAMIVATIIWGTSFIAIKFTVNSISPGLLICFRFLIGSLLLLCLCKGRFKNISKKFVIFSILTGFALGLGYLIQTVGLVYTPTSTSSLLENVYLIVVPFLSWAIARQRPRAITFLCCLATLIGVVLISYNSLSDIQNASPLGITLSALAGVFYGVNIAFSGIMFRDKDPVVFTLIQFVTITVMAFIYYLVFERSIPTFNLKSILGLIFLGILCSGIAWILRNFAQNHLSPNRISIILSFTSVVALIISIIIKETEVNLLMILGTLLIVGSIIVDSSVRHFKNKKIEDHENT